jgi:hypothetical protein
MYAFLRPHKVLGKEHNFVRQCLPLSALIVLMLVCDVRNWNKEARFRFKKDKRALFTSQVLSDLD